MRSNLQRFVWIGCLLAVFCFAAMGSQKDSKANLNPPAVPQAKITQPATHFTQGTITSIDANQMVVTKKVRGKAQQTAFRLNSQTQLTGNLANGTRVSVQYHEEKSEKTVVSVRELSTKGDAKQGKAAFKPGSKG